MFKRMIASLMLILLLTLPVSAAGTVTPYAIKVNRAMNTVTIYEMDDDGRYTVPIKAMICSTARTGYITPLGSYRLAEFRSPWRLMVDGTYGQYATCFKGNYLFHSICYADDSHDAMLREAYNKLGEAASMGCVRLETADAKWIYDNCPAGTPVTIYDDFTSPGPLGKPERTVDEISEDEHCGWDPTDPAEGNPWHMTEVAAVKLQPQKLTLTAGETAQATALVEPENAIVYWNSSDEAVARVDSKGNITALTAGKATISAQGLNGVGAKCEVMVKGELLPFDDLLPGAWYYPEVRKAMENGLFQGVGEREFAPDRSMTRAMVVQVLYNLAGRPDVQAILSFEDVMEDAWYREAVAWAAAEGVVNGVSETAFAPDKAMSRQELATVLWRYAGEPKSEQSLTDFSDEASIAEFAELAMVWAVEEGLMQGSGGKLQPAKTATRVQCAAILQRYCK